jgi:hypothetical protein
MVLKVGKLVLCCEDSCCCDGGGGELGSDFGWIFGSLMWGMLFAMVAEDK